MRLRAFAVVLGLKGSRQHFGTNNLLAIIERHTMRALKGYLFWSQGMSGECLRVFNRE
jgi:hypothetical protein